MLANWLLDGGVDVGDPLKIRPDYVTFPPLSADPTLSTGTMWFRGDLGRFRYSPDGVIVKDFSTVFALSELAIDVDKDWAGKNILNLTPYGFNIDKTTEALISIGFAEAGLQYLSIIYDFTKNGTIPTGLMLFPGKKTWRTADQTYAIYRGSGYSCGSDYVSVTAGRDLPGTGYCGSMYVAWNLPTFTELIFIGRPYFGSPASVMLYADTSTPSALANNYYRLYLHTPNTTKDFVLEKRVAGTTTELGYEAVDLTEPGPHTVFLYYNKSTGAIKAYRDGRLKISVTDTSLSPVAVGFHQGNPTYDSVTTYWHSPLFVVVK